MSETIQLVEYRMVHEGLPPPEPKVQYLSKMWRTTFMAPNNMTIVTGANMIIPLGMDFDIDKVDIFVTLPLYVSDTLNMDCQLIRLPSQGVCAVSRELFMTDWHIDDVAGITYQEICGVPKGHPIIAIHTMNPLTFTCVG